MAKKTDLNKGPVTPAERGWIRPAGTRCWKYAHRDAAAEAEHGDVRMDPLGTVISVFSLVNGAITETPLEGDQIAQKISYGVENPRSFWGGIMGLWIAIDPNIHSPLLQAASGGRRVTAWANYSTSYDRCYVNGRHTLLCPETPDIDLRAPMTARAADAFRTVWAGRTDLSAHVAPAPVVAAADLAAADLAAADRAARMHKLERNSRRK